VLLFPEGMVKLNASAGQILLRCDGKKSVAEIIAELEIAFAATGLGADVEAFLKVAADKGWVEWAVR
jgi:pyrroloquinoline quinone biosynthesis protein D